MTRIFALAGAAALALTACSSSDPTTSSSVPAPPTVASTTTQPTVTTTVAADDLSEYALLDEYCAAAEAFADGYVFGWDGLSADDPAVKAHNDRLDSLVALAPPSHAQDWNAIVDVSKRLTTMDVVSGEPASVVRTMDRRINPDMQEHCGVAL